MAGAQGRPRQTSLDHIIEAALEDGLGTFSMPSIGSRLGIAPSGIYRYVRSRQHLLELALQRIVTQAPWPPPTLPWREQLTAIGEAFWWMCETHPGCATVMHATPSITEHVRATLATHADSLAKQGLTTDETWSAIELVSAHAVNSALLAEQRAGPGETRGGYQHNLDVYLDGLTSRLDQDSREV